MKIALIILAVLAALFLIGQIWITVATNKTESHAYKVIKDYDDFEVRKYQPALFSYVVMKANSYKSGSNKGFRALAGYIFGGNETNEKIAMTTPVEMSMDDSMTMKFKIPDGMNMDEMPRPNNPNVQFSSEPEKTVAAIRFNGRASDESISKNTAKLKTLLKVKGISHKDHFSYLGYNPPYQLIGRRNEIIVELVEFSATP